MSESPTTSSTVVGWLIGLPTIAITKLVKPFGRANHISHSRYHVSIGMSYRPIPPRTLLLPLHHIPEQLQPLHRESHHVLLPVLTPRFHFPGYRLSSISRNSQRHITRRSVPCLTTRRSCCAALADGIRAPECFACVFCKPGDNFWSRPGVIGDVLRCPTGESDAGFECVEG
jgi:hypothetical protein